MEMTTTERLIMLALELEPNQTAAALQRRTGTKTFKHLVRTLRTLVLARILTRTMNEDGITGTYSIAEVE